ncbi:prepilin-type N-terminal cleavage/methylation domain-containing protein [Colwellia chukchiensis]|uniref:Prepilin-type N-terminal cleavage/methylation domain-containing protein n=1 Tax=Colwellia chukchiensis TaxID=641665 RepID=A0A1H7HFV5_9GAMM|nr:prepilin-type N-terminal cleavage/methylation domain-containing protein [Colwellia chukchiensis]SEK47125.1 prepilin-type N-terminal cleavage/methylation domain-containing protein [Colwellia chukchiensis]
MKKNSGFTLVEMLVAMVLLSMVLLIASSAYALFSERWDGRLGHFNRSVKQAKQLILVQEALKSVVSYVVTDDNKRAKLYFEGNRNGFVGVTLRSLFSPEVAAVVRVQIIQKADFSYQLIYQESAMTTQLLTQAKQALTFTDAVVLYDNLTAVEFQYYGWPSLRDKHWQADSAISARQAKAWFSNYNSLERNVQPEQIKITFSTEQGDFTLLVPLSDSVPNSLARYTEQV